MYGPNDYRAYVENLDESVYHHGVKGQKWGKRRWQNEDGSLTPEGYKHYGRLGLGLGAAAAIGGGIATAVGARHLTRGIMNGDPSSFNKGSRLARVGRIASGVGTIAGSMGAYHLSTSKDARLAKEGKISQGEYNARRKGSKIATVFGGIPGTLIARAAHDSDERKAKREARKAKRAARKKRADNMNKAVTNQLEKAKKRRQQQERLYRTY